MKYFFPFALSLALFHFVQMGLAMREEWRVQKAKEDLHRLGMITVQLVQKGRPIQPETFWQELGNAKPLQDPWGANYRLRATQQTATWSSVSRPLSESVPIAVVTLPEPLTLQVVAPAK